MKLAHILIPLFGYAALGYVMLDTLVFDKKEGATEEIVSLDLNGAEGTYINPLIDKLIIDACTGGRAEGEVSGYIKVGLKYSRWCREGTQQVTYIARCARPNPIDVPIEVDTTKCVSGEPLQFSRGIVNDADTIEFMIKTKKNEIVINQ